MNSAYRLRPGPIQGSKVFENTLSHAQNQSELPLKICPEQRFQPFALTDIQYAYWIGRSGFLASGNVSCHVYPEIDVVDLDIDRLNQAILKLVERHDMLRVVVLADGRQQINKPDQLYALTVDDLRGYGPKAVRQRLEKTRHRMSHQVLDSKTGPLFEIRASLLDNDITRLHISFDLLIGDGQSFNVLIRDLYHYYLTPDTELPPLEISFQDYVRYRTDLKGTLSYLHDMVYWKQRIEDLPRAPDLPVAVNPMALASRRFRRLESKLEKDRWTALKRHAAESGLTPSGLLLASFAEVLAAWIKSRDFTINLTLFDRPKVHDQINDIVGDFTTMVLLAVHHDQSLTFENRALMIQERQQKDLSHSLVSGVEVIRELATLGGKDLNTEFPVVFTNMLPYGSRQDDAFAPKIPPGLPVRLNYCISQTPQVWLDNQVFEYQGRLFVHWDAVDGLFPGQMLEDMFQAWCQLLNVLAKDRTAWQQQNLIQLPLLQAGERKAANDTDTPRSDELLHTLFDKQAAFRPGKEAVVTPHLRLTYEDLALRALKLSRLLKSHGARPDTLVAVVMEKGWEQVAAVLGILYSGAAYLPVDASMPGERRDKILKDGEVRIVLTQSWLEKDLTWPGGVRVFSVDRTGPAVEKEPLVPVQTAGNLAYVIYTSGSTGDPKGVMIDHKGAVNTLLDINRRFHVGPADKIFALVEMSFDLSVYDVFGVLSAGGTVVIPDFKKKNDPEHWLELMVAEGVTIWNSVPQPVQLVYEYSKHRDVLPGELRLVLMSGDWIPTDLPGKINSVYPGVEIVGLGGATEASIWSIFYPIGKKVQALSSIPYGKPLANQKFYVLDQGLFPCPDWVPGYLYIAGSGLAKGYWKDETKTADSFIIHPLTGERLYRTGDLGRYLPDANIEFLGREDCQVKIRGYRIELGEIEAALKNCPGVLNVVAAAVEDSRGDRCLAAYVVPEQGALLSWDQLKPALRARLPEYMVPTFFVPMARIPLTANGKIDRRGLPDPEKNAAGKKSCQVLPRNQIEQAVATIVEGILNVQGLGRHDNFFDLGAHSLNIIRIQNRLMEEFGKAASSLNLFEHTTISAVARYIGPGKKDDDGGGHSPERAQRRKSAARRRGHRTGAVDM